MADGDFGGLFGRVSVSRSDKSKDSEFDFELFKAGKHPNPLKIRIRIGRG